MGLLIAYLLLALLVSFLCSILEAVILSVTPSFVAIEEQKSAARAAKLKALKSDIDKPLSAILSLNTIAHTIGATGVGAQAQVIFENDAIGYVSAGMTFLILVFSEIIPKTIGASYWKKLVPFTVKSLEIMLIVMYPFILLSKVITKIMGTNKEEEPLSREDFTALTVIGKEQGVLDDNESEMMKNLLALKEVRVEDIMTPRTVVVAVQQDLSILELADKKDIITFSRIPVYEKDLDTFTGYIVKSELFKLLLEKQFDKKLFEIRRDILVVDQTMVVPDLFAKLIDKREHIAMVVGEFGEVVGLITMEDILETLIGLEIVDESDTVVDMQKLAKQLWKNRKNKGIKI